MAESLQARKVDDNQDITVRVAELAPHLVVQIQQGGVDQGTLCKVLLPIFWLL